jgi:polyketide biosynthesis enoyl-CoA hydratase PksI
MEMLLTAKFYKGRELAGRGLFNHVVRDKEVMPMVVDLARRVAEKAPHVIRMIKETLAAPRRRALDDAIAREHVMHGMCFGRPEAAAILQDGYLT